MHVLGTQHPLVFQLHKSKKKKFRAVLQPSEAVAPLIFWFATFSIWICDSSRETYFLIRQIWLSAWVTNPNDEGSKSYYQRRHSLGRGESRSEKNFLFSWGSKNKMYWVPNTCIKEKLPATAALEGECYHSNSTISILDISKFTSCNWPKICSVFLENRIIVSAFETDKQRKGE